MGTDRDWIDLLQQKMAEHSAPAPEGLWERIDSSLPETAAPVRKFPLHWAAVLTPLAVAACLAVLVVNNLFLRNSDEALKEDTMVAELVKDAGFDASRDEEARKLAVDIIAESRKPKPVRTIVKEAASEESRPVTSVTVCPQKAEEPSAVEIEEKKEDTPAATEKKETLTKEKITQIMEEYPWNEEFTEKKNRLRLADNLSVSMHGASKSGVGGKFMMDREYCDAGIMKDMFSGEPVTKSAQKVGMARTPRTSEYKWQIASEVDFLAEKYLGRRFNVSSGLGWTILEGKSPNSDKRVRADYIGVPVLAGYDLVQNPRLNLGIDAGVKASIAVKGPDAVKVDKFLFSATAGLNASTPLTDYLALRLGAGMEYFMPGDRETGVFDAGKPVANVSAGLVWIFR